MSDRADVEHESLGVRDQPARWWILSPLLASNLRLGLTLLFGFGGSAAIVIKFETEPGFIAALVVMGASLLGLVIPQHLTVSRDAISKTSSGPGGCRSAT